MLFDVPEQVISISVVISEMSFAKEQTNALASLTEISILTTLVKAGVLSLSVELGSNIGD